MNKKIAVIILAAGKGTRMKSALPKVLHPVLGKPMIYYPVNTALSLKPFEILPVLSWKKELVEEYLLNSFGPLFNFVYQKTPLGTADAVKSALNHISDTIDTVIIMSGDVPLVTCDVLTKLIEQHKTPFTITTMELNNPSGYGRILRKSGKIAKILEEKDANPEEKAIKEVNAGLYCFDKNFLKKYIPLIRQNEKTKEFYLTDLVDLAVNDGIEISSFATDNPQMFLGINTRIELANVTEILQQTTCEKLMLSGVTIIDPKRVYIETDINVGADSTIYPDVVLSGNTQIGEHCVIESGAIIKDSHIANHAHIKAYTVIENSKIGNAAVIGPFAHLRPETVIEDKAKIGNFVETKKTTMKKGSKANHLTYLGDALVEENVNVGAGTITCNYDGVHKHFTHIKKGAFIGSNTALVAPVVIGENAVIGAGSVITKDVPEDTLAVERSEQRHISNWSKVKTRIKK